VPLTAAKLAHLTALYAKVVLFRQQAVTLTLRQSGGGTTTLGVNCVFKPLADLDPAFDPVGAGISDIKGADAYAMFLETDVTLAQLRSCLYLTINSPVGSDLVASRYIPTSIAAKGLPAGGDRYLVTFERQR
jgi:hypothetical protein